MPESLDIDEAQIDDNKAYPVRVTLRHLRKNTTLYLSGTEDAPTNAHNGMFRSNLVADSTDQVLDQAKADRETFTEVVKAKYVVGTDGAHSWTRRQIGSVLEGEQTDFVWYCGTLCAHVMCKLTTSKGAFLILFRSPIFVSISR
jgi:phenol 2-monooxygenase